MIGWRLLNLCPEEMTHNANSNSTKIRNAALTKLIGQKLKMKIFLSLFKKMEQEIGIKLLIISINNKYLREMASSAEKDGLTF